MTEALGIPSAAGLATRAIHAGSSEAAVNDPVSSPIYLTSTFLSDPDGGGEILYTRYGNNPNHAIVEKRLADLEGTDGCIVFGSGMGAMTSAVLACVEAGDHVLAANALYGGTRVLLERELARLDIETDFADFTGSDWLGAIRENTRLLVVEIPSNPLIRVTDPAPIVAAARRIGASVLVDATFATPVNFRPIEHGVDLIVHSATKYLGGHSDITAGAVCGGAEILERVRARARIFGATLDPHAAWLLERGLKTLPLRMAKHNANGLAVARWCEKQPGIARVHYAGLDSHPDHDVASRLLDGYGGMLSFELAGGEDAASRFVRRLRLAKLAPSLGGVETLVSEPRHTSHATMTSEQRAAQGIGDGFVRFSVGIEDADDIIADIAGALEA
jgi:cystathionine beta-lyase/cystathionine gamma-synthase